MISCLATDVIEERVVTRCEVVNAGFEEVAQNQKVQVKFDKDGKIYYSLKDLQSVLGFEYFEAESGCIYNSTQNCGSPCIVLIYNGEKYELFDRFFCLLAEDNISIAHNYPYSALYSKNDEEIFVSQSVFTTILNKNLVVTANGDIYVLDDNGKAFHGTHGLTKPQRKAVKDAMFLLYAKSRSDYQTIMEFTPSFCAISQSDALKACGRKTGAYVNFDSPVIHIVYDSFNAKTDSFAALLLHEATHWVVGYQGLSTETTPSEHEIRCLIRLGVPPERIQARINQYIKITEYKNGGRLGQKLLDIELQRQEGEWAAKHFFLPIDEKVHVPLGKFLIDEKENKQ